MRWAGKRKLEHLFAEIAEVAADHKRMNEQPAILRMQVGKKSEPRIAPVAIKFCLGEEVIRRSGCAQTLLPPCLVASDILEATSEQRFFFWRFSVYGLCLTTIYTNANTDKATLRVIGAWGW